MAAQKPHTVLVPYPAQGHVNPMMQLAKLLHSRGFHVTFVNTEFNHRRLLRSQGPDSLNGLDDFRFETIPDGLPPSDKDATQDVPALCESTRKNCLTPFVSLIERLNSTTGLPAVSLIVGDGVMSFAIEAGRMLGIPEIQFWTASAGGFMGYIHYRELIRRGLTPLKDESYVTNGYLDMPIDWIPGMKNVKLRDLPSFIRTTDPNDIMLDFLGEEAQNCLNSSTILYNTFDDLEHDVLNAIKSYKFPNIYTIGPLPLLVKQLLPPEGKLASIRSSLWKEDLECMKWLNQRAPNSVVYANFGSITVMTEKQLTEFAWGLANSKQHFLWIIRPDAVTTSVSDEFVRETRDRGMLTSWCPQDVILAHPSVGVFVTHCGWNSMVESVCSGVPVVCWPFFAEQTTNCWYACNVWEIGMEIENDVRRDVMEEVVREMMEGIKGKKMRRNALKLKAKAREATKKGGSSYGNFDVLVKGLLHKN